MVPAVLVAGPAHSLVARDPRDEAEAVGVRVVVGVVREEPDVVPHILLAPQPEPVLLHASHRKYFRSENIGDLTHVSGSHPPEPLPVLSLEDEQETPQVSKLLEFTADDDH